MSAIRPYDLDLIRKSFEVAKKARDGGDHPFGSVLGDETGALLMEQGNGYSAEGGDRTAHAERLLASRAAKAYPLEKLAKMTLYTSAEPCAMCAGAMMHARLTRVVYGAADPKTGACGSIVNLFVEEKLNHHTAVTGGVLSDECSSMLSSFFAERRLQSRTQKA